MYEAYDDKFGEFYERLTNPKTKRIIVDESNGLEPIVVEIWSDGDVVLKQGSDTIQISAKQFEKLINLS